MANTAKLVLLGLVVLLAFTVVAPEASAHTYVGVDRNGDGDCADFAERTVILPAGDSHTCV